MKKQFGATGSIMKAASSGHSLPRRRKRWLRVPDGDESLSEFLKDFEAAIDGGSGIFPLGPIPPPPKPCTKNRRSLNRFRRAWKVWSWAEQIRHIFNGAWTGPATTVGQKCFDASEGLQCRRLSSSTVATAGDRFHLRLLRAAAVQSAACRVSEEVAPTGMALWTRLRKNVSSVYGRAEIKCAYQPMRAHDLKELPAGAPTVSIEEGADAEVWEAFNCKERVLKVLTAAEQLELKDLQRRYDHCGGDDREWNLYHRRTDIRGLWSYEDEDDIRGEMRVAAALAVGRAKDAQQRKIMAAVPGNFCQRELSDILPGREELTDQGMMGGASLSRVRTKRRSFHWAGLDETQAFTSVVVPRFLALLQVGPCVSIESVPADLRKPGWNSKTRVRPVYLRLAMGGSHSVFILMNIHLRTVGRVLIANARLSRFRVLNRREVRLFDGEFSGEDGIIYVHVDDFVIGHNLQVIADLAAQEIETALRALGFLVTSEVGGVLRKFVGYARSASGKRLSLPAEKKGDLGRAFWNLSESYVVYPAAVHTVTSVYIWGSLLWRPGMSAAAELFRFNAAFLGFDGLVPLPELVRRELKMMWAMLPFLECDLGRWCFPAILCQDASGGDKVANPNWNGAYSLALCVPSVSLLQEMLFRQHAEGKLARKLAALESNGSLYAESIPRTCLPVKLFDGSTRWWSILSREFRKKVHINEGEAIPVVQWLRILVGNFEVGGAEVIDLSDNSATSGGVTHGRSPSVPQNHRLRQRAVVEAVGDVRLRTSWTPTIFQPADGGTRLGREDTAARRGVIEIDMTVPLVCCVGQSGTWKLLKDLLDEEATCVTWDNLGGRKRHIMLDVGFQYLISLIRTGQVGGVVWWQCTNEKLEQIRAKEVYQLLTLVVPDGLWCHVTNTQNSEIDFEFADPSLHTWSVTVATGDVYTLSSSRSLPWLKLPVLSSPSVTQLRREISSVFCDGLQRLRVSRLSTRTAPSRSACGAELEAGSS